MKKILSIVNPRQGAGKTGLAVNIAACLAVLEKKTLLVDADPQGDASACLLGEEAVAGSGLDDCLTDQVAVSATVRDTALDFLKIIPAGKDLFRFEQEVVRSPDGTDQLRRKINDLAGDFAYVIMDSPASLGHWTAAVIAASEAVLMPLPCRRDAQASLEALLPVVAEVKRQRRPELTIAGIVLTLCDDAAEIRALLPEDTMTAISSLILATVVPRQILADAAGSCTGPAILRDVMSTASERFLDLTAELLAR
jgi:chromosome partitioning protein